MKQLGYHIILICLLLASVANAQKADFVVDASGNGDFTTVQAAFDAVPHFRKAETVIFIKNGVYKEKLLLASSKTNITLIGESVEKTIITHDDYASKLNAFGEEMGTTGSTTFYVFGDNFYAQNITFENSAGPVGQAVAVRVDGDQVVFDNCRFIGFQDTLYPHGDDSRQYYLNCYIEGTTDFIFGWSTAVFENCEIHSKKGGNYITAASTTEETAYGFLFMNCRFTAEEGVSAIYLGRPWRPFAQTVIIDSYLGVHINPKGWHNWDKPDAETTSFYAEYNNNGPGADMSQRVSWSHQLKADHSYTKAMLFRDWEPIIKKSRDE